MSKYCCYRDLLTQEKGAPYINVHKAGLAVVLHQRLIVGALQQVWICPGLQELG